MYHGSGLQCPVFGKEDVYKRQRLHEKHEESSGIFSSKSTDVYDYSNLDAVVGSNISGGSVDVTSGADTNITASTVVADDDVNIKTGGELNIGTQEQTSELSLIHI